MTRKALAIVAVTAASFGLLWAEDPPAEVLPATALAPPPVINLTPTPAPALAGLNLESLSFAPQTEFVIARPVGGFRPSGDAEKALFNVNLLALVGLNVADYFSTRAALNYPGLHESNPLMTPFVKSPAAFAAIKLGTTALTYLGLKAIFKKNRTVAWVLTTASNVVLSYVVANNMQMIHQARAR